jgi:hypothetical protein
MLRRNARKAPEVLKERENLKGGPLSIFEKVSGKEEDRSEKIMRQ